MVQKIYSVLTCTVLHFFWTGEEGLGGGVGSLMHGSDGTKKLHLLKDSSLCSKSNVTALVLIELLDKQLIIMPK